VVLEITKTVRRLFDESLAGNTTLLQLTEKAEQEFAIPN
jgi:hypothetical protein